MQRLSESTTKLGTLWALALCAPLLMPACSTDYSDQPIKTGNLSASEISMLPPSTLLVLDGTGSAGLLLVTSLDVDNQLLRLRVDGHYVVDSADSSEYLPVVSRGAFATVPSGSDVTAHQPPGGFPAGTHALALERDDGSTLVTTMQDFAADAFNTVVVHGSMREAAVRFFSDAVPADPSLLVVRVLNITTNKESLTVTGCFGTPPCTPMQSTLAYGDSWVATLSGTDVPPQVIFPQEATTCVMGYLSSPPYPQDWFFALVSPIGCQQAP